MPRSIKGDEEVVDPLTAAPKLNGGESGTGEPDPARPAQARVRRRKGQEAELVVRRPARQAAAAKHLAERHCACGHSLAPDVKFCSACGSPVITQPVLSKCRNDHDVAPDDKFCAMCGVPLGPVVNDAAPADSGYRDPSTMTPAELAVYENAHRRALLLGKENPVLTYAPGQAPPGAQTVLIHFLIDGFGAFGNVWYRGQEIELWPGHPRWREAQDWIMLDVAGQYRRYGRQVFGTGPWPGVRSYTAGVGRFERLALIGGDGVVGEPTAAELQQADMAEAHRARRVPLPIG